MSNSKTGWLNDSPLMPDAGGPGPINTPLIGAVTMRHGDLVNFYNLLVSPNWKGLLVGGFADAKEWVTRLMRFPFPVPSINIQRYLKYGAVDSGSLPIEGKHAICFAPAFIVPGGNPLRSMGKVFINRYFNNFLDYTGYTKIELYLPFCGSVEVLPNDCIDKWLFVDLFVDYYTGKGNYYISVSEDENADSSYKRIILTKECTIGYDIPLGGTNANASVGNMVRGAVKTMASVAMLGALSGATTTHSGTTTSTKQMYNAKGKLTGTNVTTDKINHTTQHHIGDGTIASMAVSGSMDAISNLQATAQSDRCNNPMLELAGPKSVKVVIKRPKPIPVGEDYNKIYGRPAAYTKRLGDLTGYTRITGIHLENLSSALSEELEILERILKVGVILDGENQVIFPPDPTEGQLLQTVNNEYIITSDNNYIELED